jgi:hypothetical protein
VANGWNVRLGTQQRTAPELALSVAMRLNLTGKVTLPSDHQLRENLTSDRTVGGTRVSFFIEVDVSAAVNSNKFYWSCQYKLHISVALTAVRRLK